MDRSSANDAIALDDLTIVSMLCIIRQSLMVVSRADVRSRCMGCFAAAAKRCRVPNGGIRGIGDPAVG